MPKRIAHHSASSIYGGRRTLFARAAVEEAPENWVIYYLVKNPKDESTKRKRGDGEEIPTHFMADLMKRAIWVRCYELVVENGGKEEYTATSSCPGTGVNPVTSDDDNTFVARALFFETPQVLSANALGNIVYLPFSGAHRWHRTFVHRLSIANAAEDGVNEKAQLAIKLYDGGIERPLLVFKRDLVDDPKVLGKALVLKGSLWEIHWLLFDRLGLPFGFWVTEPSHLLGVWTYLHTIWALHRTGTNKPVFCRNRSERVSYVTDAETTPERCRIWTQRLARMIHGRKEDEESEQSYTEEERKGSAILQDEDPKVIEDSD